MQSRNDLPARLLVLLLMTLITSLSQALPSDREQPIKITADSAVRNEQTGETRYEGSVELTQGSLHIEADLLTLYQYDGAADGRQQHHRIDKVSADLPQYAVSLASVLPILRSVFRLFVHYAPRNRR